MGMNEEFKDEDPRDNKDIVSNLLGGANGAGQQRNPNNVL